MEALPSVARQAPSPPAPWPVCRHHQHQQRPTYCRARQQQHVKQRQRVAALRRAGCAATTAAGAGRATTTSTSGEGGADTAAALAGVRYTSPDGAWVVRPLDKANAAEVRRVVALQTDAFHTAAPLPLFDGMAKSFFKAEVLSEMQKKLKFNPDDMFLSLVIEPAETEGAAAEPAGPSSSSSGGDGGSGSGACNVVGVIEISYIAAKETLKLLEPGTDAFCYIASMVVAPAWRRRGGAAALLAAAEAAAAAWEERQTLLHVHQDNLPAIQLYERFGYEVIHQTNNTFAGLGPKPRYLMRKRW